jgi:glycogen debranching enzyme
MNEVLGGEDDVSDLVEEKARLEQLINTKLWDEETQFYYDLWDDDTLNGVKHLGGYWSLISHAIPHEHMQCIHKGNRYDIKRIYKQRNVGSRPPFRTEDKRIHAV